MSETPIHDDVLLAGYDFDPTCEFFQCENPAPWSGECVYGCGFAAFVCDTHRDFMRAGIYVERCPQCGMSAPVRNLVLFRALEVKP